MLQVETFHRKPEELHTYKSRIVSGQNVMVVASVDPDKSIYLTRVSDAYEFKPSLNKAPVTTASSTNQTSSKGNKSSGGGDDASSDDEKVTAITMRFANVHEDEKRRQREASYAYMMERAEQEEWKEFEFVTCDSERGKDVRGQLGTLF